MILKLGMTGPDVLNLELVLQGMGFEGFNSADGVFDSKTENIIKYIQRSHALKEDGIVGDKTLAVIDFLYQPLIANFAKEHTPEITPDPTGEFPAGTEELAKVNPVLARKVLQIIGLAKQEGYSLTTVQGLRTFAEQDKLFAQRPKVTNARGGQSYHNYGVAVDLAFIINGKINWDDKYYRNIGRWASQVGLTWGGNWHFVDYPHVQLAAMPSVSALLAVYWMTAGDQTAKINAIWNKYVGG